MSLPGRPGRLAGASVLWLALAAGPAGAQRIEVDFDSPEGWAMKYFAAVAVPSAFGAPSELSPGGFELGLEYVQVPSLDLEQRRVGFGGVKVEDLNKVPYVLRPVARVGLGWKLALAATWVPPVEWNGAEPNIVSLAIERPVIEGESWRLGLRLYGQVGTVEGDFTCSRQTVAGGEDPALNPFGCEAVSSDQLDLATVGLEASASWPLGADGRWEPFAEVSYNTMDLEFQVDAQYSGFVDRSRRVTDGETLYLVAGLGYRMGERWRLAGELFYAPLDVVRPGSTRSENDELVNARVQLLYGFD
jgi:hypothetical protein